MILQKIANETRSRVEAEKILNPIEDIKKIIYEKGELSSFTGREIYSFEKALGSGTRYRTRYGARYGTWYAINK